MGAGCFHTEVICTYNIDTREPSENQKWGEYLHWDGHLSGTMVHIRTYNTIQYSYAANPVQTIK